LKLLDFSSSPAAMATVLEAIGGPFEILLSERQPRLEAVKERSLEM